MTCKNVPPLNSRDPLRVNNNDTISPTIGHDEYFNFFKRFSFSFNVTSMTIQRSLQLILNRSVNEKWNVRFARFSLIFCRFFFGEFNWSSMRFDRCDGSTFATSQILIELHLRDQNHVKFPFAFFSHLSRPADASKCRSGHFAKQSTDQKVGVLNNNINHNHPWFVCTGRFVCRHCFD